MTPMHASMNYAKLYKRTSTGAIQVWWQERDNDRYRTHSGQDGGAIVTSEWTVAQPKNVGKANETTGETQAEAEVASNYDLKRKKGYTDTPSEAEASTRFQPMLAKVYEDEQKHLTKLLAKGGNVCVQPKLDGIRCIARKDGLVSRNGTPIVAVPHIEAALKPIFDEFPGLVLDGELYNHDLKHDFPKLVSLVRKAKPTAEDFDESRVMQLWVYDLPSSTQEFYARLAALGMLVYGRSDSIVVVETPQAGSVSEIEAHFLRYIEEGYEGLMIRDPNSVYEQKRSKSLLKYKPEMDSEYTILDIEEGVGNRTGMAGRVKIALPNDKYSYANPIGDRDYLRRMLAAKDTLRGKTATVLYYGLTPDGVPRFPRVKVVHTETKW